MERIVIWCMVCFISDTVESEEKRRTDKEYCTIVVYIAVRFWRQSSKLADPKTIILQMQLQIIVNVHTAILILLS